MVVTISGILAGVMAQVFSEATRSQNRLTIRTALLRQAQTAVERIRREIQDTDKDSVDPTSADLDLAATEEVRLGQIGYRLNGADLQRTEDGGTSWQTIAISVSSLTFDYQDDVGAALNPLPLSTANRKLVRRVRVSLSLAEQGEVLDLMTLAYFRKFAFETGGDG